MRLCATALKLRINFSANFSSDTSCFKFWSVCLSTLVKTADKPFNFPGPLWI